MPLVDRSPPLRVGINAAHPDVAAGGRPELMDDAGLVRWAIAEWEAKELSEKLGATKLAR